MFLPLHTVRGFPSFLQLCLIRPSQTSQDWVHETGLSERQPMNSAHFTFKSLWLTDFQSWKDLQSCRQVTFPKPSRALPATKTRRLSSCHIQNVWSFSYLPAQPTQVLRHQQTFLLGMTVCLSCGAANAWNECSLQQCLTTAVCYPQLLVSGGNRM